MCIWVIFFKKMRLCTYYGDKTDPGTCGQCINKAEKCIHTTTCYQTTVVLKAQCVTFKWLYWHEMEF